MVVLAQILPPMPRLEIVYEIMKYLVGLTNRYLTLYKSAEELGLSISCNRTLLRRAFDEMGFNYVFIKNRQKNHFLSRIDWALICLVPHKGV